MSRERDKSETGLHPKISIAHVFLKPAKIQFFRLKNTQFMQSIYKDNELDLKAVSRIFLGRLVAKH